MKHLQCLNMKFLLTFFMIPILNVFYVSGFDKEIIRDSCFINKQEGCNTEFTDVYPDLSRSTTGKLANTYMFLFTKENKDEPEKLHKCGGRLPPNSNFNPNNKVILIGPSFLTSYCEFDVYDQWKEELLQKEDANVLIIDYGWEGADYIDAHSNLRLVAKQIIMLLNNIKEQTGVSELEIIIIGISLGAQLAGYIGRYYREEGHMVKRIIGLDPAGPLFNLAPEWERLDPTDANFVEFWHCNRGEDGATYDGGHVNYMINGGIFQASCHDTNMEAFKHGEIALAAGTVVACSHIQCTKYFQESINPRDCQFVGVKCDKIEDFMEGKCKNCGSNGEKCIIMGYDTDKFLNEIPKIPQKYYVHTTLKSPFCDKNHVDLEGYAPVYESSLPKNPCNIEEVKPESFFSKIKKRIIDSFINMLYN